MNKIFLLILMLLVSSVSVNAKQKCSDLEGFKNIEKSKEYFDCLKSKSKGKFKLNTDSKLKDWITGKEKFKLPNPATGMKKIGEAIKPSAGKNWKQKKILKD